MIASGSVEDKKKSPCRDTVCFGLKRMDVSRGKAIYLCAL